jgi:hypothetical protein
MWERSEPAPMVVVWLSALTSEFGLLGRHSRSLLGLVMAGSGAPEPLAVTVSRRLPPRYPHEEVGQIL